jgi:hypothetical protein
MHANDRIMAEELIGNLKFATLFSVASTPQERGDFHAIVVTGTVRGVGYAYAMMGRGGIRD